MATRCGAWWACWSYVYESVARCLGGSSDGRWRWVFPASRRAICRSTSAGEAAAGGGGRRRAPRGRGRPAPRPRCQNEAPGPTGGASALRRPGAGLTTALAARLRRTDGLADHSPGGGDATPTHDPLARAQAAGPRPSPTSPRSWTSLTSTTSTTRSSGASAARTPLPRAPRMECGSGKEPARPRSRRPAAFLGRTPPGMRPHRAPARRPEGLPVPVSFRRLHEHGTVASSYECTS